MTMNVLEAAVHVLKSAGEALHVDEITKRMLEAGLWASTSQTPSTSVGRELSKEINKNGDKSVLVRVSPQTYDLLDFNVKAKDLNVVFQAPPEKAPAVTVAVEKGPVGEPLVEKPFEMPSVDAPPTVKEPLEDPLAEPVPMDDPAVQPSIKEPLTQELHSSQLFPDMPPPQSPPKTYHFAVGAMKVLESSVDKKPMHYRDIIAAALEKGWLLDGGDTPEVSMSSEVIDENNARQARGERPRFVQHGGGYLGMSDW